MKRTAPYDLSDYFGMVRRSWWVILICTLLGGAAAFAYAIHQPKVYSSTTAIQVLPTILDTNQTSGRTASSVNLDTESNIIKSVGIAEKVQQALGTTESVANLLANVSVAAPANSTILNVTFTAGTPQAAHDGSHQFAASYLQARGAAADQSLALQMSKIQSLITPLKAQLSKETEALARSTKGDPNAANLQIQKENDDTQLKALETKLYALSAMVQTPGSIVSDANLPTKPILPVIPIEVGSGVLVGLLVGLGLGFARERMDRLVRRPGDVSRVSDLVVLAELPVGVKPLVDDVYPISGVAGRTFGRLRNEIAPSLRTAGHGVLVVTSASRGASSAIVAANIAAAFARSGERVVLVGGSTAAGSPLSRIVDVNAAPGLLDVLSGRVQLGDALQRAARCPGLSVLPIGGAASAGGLFQAEALRNMLSELRHRADIVVIEAPSTSQSSDAQTLAALADASIITIETRKTKRTELDDSVDQLSHVCPAVLGVVALPRFEVPARVPGGPTTPALRGGGTVPALAPGNNADTAETKVFKDNSETKVLTAVKDDGISDDPTFASTARDGTAESASSTIVMQRVSDEDLEVATVDGVQAVNGAEVSANIVR